MEVDVEEDRMKELCSKTVEAGEGANAVLVDRQPPEPEECAEVVLHLEGRCQCPVFAEPPTSGKE